MISKEPVIRVGLMEHASEVRGVFHGPFDVAGVPWSGEFYIRSENNTIVLSDAGGKAIMADIEVECRHTNDATCTINDVSIGIQFHWERKERQTFQGDVRFVARHDGTITVINLISVEEYLTSVISSEMSAEAPMELLKAHAITSRSWLVAMLEREKRNVGVAPMRSVQRGNEIIRWYDREDHDIFDVCADDHCQRYQGITKILAQRAVDAIRTTKGVFLAYEDEICDARFSKACGGLSEEFPYAWEETSVPYLTNVSDAKIQYPPIRTEGQAEEWIRGNPEVFCNTSDGKILKQVLQSFDRETTDFFRWIVEYSREELEELIRLKSGYDFGTLKDLVPLQRGPSGRIVRLRIEGSKLSMTVGKELEIRRWLSKSHLYSSAFIVERELGEDGIVKRFILRGAGWGHGVGLCQIGAAVMAAKGLKAEDIVTHYYKGAELRKLY
jgi:stage II sporulation protein D